MTTVALTDKQLLRQQSVLRSVAEQIRVLTQAVEVQDVRARIEAARAWAKVHGMAKQLRLDLLTAEVEALVRIVELGGEDFLPAAECKAAQWLAKMSPKERASLVADSGAATTASGMCRSLWQAEELERTRRRLFRRGRDLAEQPGLPDDNTAVEEARERVHGVRAALAELVDDFATTGEPFTIADLADDLMQAAGVDRMVGEDEALRQGVREVCREAVTKAPTLILDGTPLPRFVTARNQDGTYMRIPVENATLQHLDDMRDLRREQLRQDQAALAELDRAAASLRTIHGCVDTTRIGELLRRVALGRTA